MVGCRAEARSSVTRHSDEGTLLTNPPLFHPGIWDVMSNQDVVTFCRRLIAEGKELDKVCELLMDRCLAPDRRASELGGIGCDNMTAVIVAFLGGQTKEAWWVFRFGGTCRVRASETHVGTKTHRQQTIKERYEADRALRGAENDATDGSDEEYTTEEDDSDSPMQPVSFPPPFTSLPFYFYIDLSFE